MKKMNLTWHIKQFKKMVENGKISFDYPIQRKGGQWDHMQQSLLIHSIVADFPIPALYSIAEEKVYYILDGKQRLTTIFSFLDDEYKLHEETPPANVDDEIYEIAGKFYSELDEEVQDSILTTNLLIYKMEDITDEEIEELFFRLNNGSSLSKDQKTRAKLGVKLANEINEVLKHEMMTDKVSLTKQQLRRSEDQTVILQSVILLNEHQFKNFSNDEVMEFVTNHRDSIDDKVIEQLKSNLDFLSDAFEKKHFLLRKVHFPMAMVMVQKAVEKEVPPSIFAEWADQFKLDYKESAYSSYCGAGSVKAVNVNGRLEEMTKHFEKYVEKVS